MHDKSLQESAQEIVGRLRRYGLSLPDIRYFITAFFLLRWVDYVEVEQEAMAVFEDRPYQPLFPVELQWRHWTQLEDPSEMAKRMHRLVDNLSSLHYDSQHSETAWLPWLVNGLWHLTDAGCVVQDLVRWVGDLPFETLSERRSLLGVFNEVLTKTGSARDGQFTSPIPIARLVAALANPLPGERVYDPCFGSGNFLIAAWQHVERSSSEMHRGPLLEVAGIEIEANSYLVGLTRMLLAGIDTPHLELGNSLERERINSPSQQGFDVVLANPPLGLKTGSVRRRQHDFAFPTNDSVGLFVQHAILQLKPSGRAVIVVPEGFLFRGGLERELRRTLVEQGQVEAVIGLPAGVFAPYAAGVKFSLLVLKRQGGASRVRMVDATPFFERPAGHQASFIRADLAQQLADEVRRPELRKPGVLPVGVPEGITGTGVVSRSIWEVSIEELAAAEWDLSPRRREKGGLDDLLMNLRGVLGETGTVHLSSVAQIFAGRSIRLSDLRDEPPIEHAIGYVRIRDLSDGKIGRCSSWLAPEIVNEEKRWTLLPGDVLLSKSGTIGKAAMVRNGAVGSVAANGLYVLRVNQERLDPGFLLGYLASAACQNWLSAQSRGAVIQHLNRAVLDDLPIPLPPLPLQALVAAQYREFGTDVLAFLAESTGIGSSDRLTVWLAEMGTKVRNFAESFDGTPALSHFEALVTMAITAQRWLELEQVPSQAVRWLAPLIDALLPLLGVAQIPQGPALLNVLQEAERGIQKVSEITTRQLPTESQVHDIAERLHRWLRAAIVDLVETGGIRVRLAPESLLAGSFAEFIVELENESALPIRGFRIETSPDWGSAQVPFLAERGILGMSMRGDVPKQGSQLSLQLHWSARNLAGQQVSGVVELALQIATSDLAVSSLGADLGGSPYVTGTPLEPQHGHSVFFGRDGVIGQISRQISTNGNVVLLEGNRRAGKTSILKHLEGRNVIPGWLAVYSSLQGAEGAKQAVGVPTAAVFREISRSIATALTKLGIDVPLPNGKVIVAGEPALGIARACREGIGIESPFSDFREYLELVLSLLKLQDLGLVLMLDEFDKLQEGIDNGVTSPQVPENIRFLIQTYPSFSAILTGSRRLKRLREAYWSALYGLGTSIPVTALDVESARSVVTEPVRDKLAYSKEAVERVVEVTARQPYLMQCLCNRVFDYAVQTKSRSITLGTVNDAATSLVRDNEHFASLWDYAGYGPDTGKMRRQLILLFCALSFKQSTHISFGTLHERLTQVGVDLDDEALDADLAYLRELELVELSGEIGEGHYQLAIPLMADWIEQQQDADVVASRARTEAEEENV